MARLGALLDLLEQAFGPAEPVPSADWWELVLAENIAYLVDNRRRWTALARLRDTVGLDPDRILAASDLALADAVTGMRPAQRIARLRRCAELALADAAWSAYPGIGRPGLDRLELFTATRAVLALDANAPRVLVRPGYGDPARSYSTTYRQNPESGRHRTAPDGARPATRTPTAAPAMPADPRLPQRERRTPAVPAG